MIILHVISKGQSVLNVKAAPLEQMHDDAKSWRNSDSTLSMKISEGGFNGHTPIIRKGNYMN